MRRFHEAKIAGDEKVVVWGSGNARREFMHVQDMADTSVHVIEIKKEKYESNMEPMMSHINVGIGTDVTIRELVATMKAVVGYEGMVEFDISKPDGPPRKLLNVDKLRKSGWKASINLERGLTDTYDWLLSEKSLRQ